MTVEVQELVDSGVFPNAETAVREALRVLWQERPAVRIEVAIHRYQVEEISLARAAALAGVSFDRMKDILAERGILLRIGPATLDEARAEVDALKRMRS